MYYDIFKICLLQIVNHYLYKNNFYDNNNRYITMLEMLDT